MPKPITITIKGSLSGDDDAPTVDDLMSQVQDIVAMLRGVEEAISDDEKARLVWKVTDVSKNSPITLEVTPFSDTYGLNVDNRASQVVVATANGLDRISKGGNRPEYFTDKVLVKAERINKRITDGLDETAIDFGDYDSIAEYRLTKKVAVTSIENISQYKSMGPRQFRELGSIEGHIARIEIDGYGRPLIWLRSRLSGKLVKCIAGDRGLDRIGHYEVSEVLKGLRVSVHGLIYYKGLHAIEKIVTDYVHVYPQDRELPNYSEIVAPNFTDGVESSKYLDTLRNDG